MAWAVEFKDAVVEAEFDGLPDDLQARFFRIAHPIEAVGAPFVREPRRQRGEVMGIPVRRVLAKKLKNPNFRRAYDALDIEFAIAQMLIEARAKAGLTQTQLAKKMGTTQSAVARLESGKRTPSIHSLESYAKATGCRLHIELVRAA